MRLVVVGAAGRMGQVLLSAVLASKDVELVGALVSGDSEHIGADIAKLIGGSPVGIQISDTPKEAFSRADVVVDFSTPAASPELARIASEVGVCYVIGTTGLTESGLNIINTASRRVPIFMSSNMSFGANVLNELVRKASVLLGDNFDVEIVEMHHREKKDAPSGTALLLSRTVAGERKKTSLSRTVAGTSFRGKREKGDIGFAVMRGGTVVGEHRVIFAGEFETVELFHRAESRNVFAFGSIAAARWLFRREPGLYLMSDMMAHCIGNDN